jgi:hypothetical protein
MNNENQYLLKKMILLYSFILCLLACDKENEGKRNYCSQSQIQCSNTNAVINSYKVDYRKQIKSKEVINESIEKEIKQLVVATNKTLIDARLATSDVLKKISQIPDQKKAFKMYDLLLDLSIEQQVTIKDYNMRQNWYAILWYNAMGAFVGAQRSSGKDFRYYEKIFRFFAKYTNEIIAVENTLPISNCQFWSISEVRKGEYLYGIKCELKTWIHLIRDLYGPELTKEFTSEQKDDLLNRFRDVELFTNILFNHPGGRKSHKKETTF